VLRMTIEENADALGLSFLGGEHLHYAGAMIEMLRQHGLGHVKVFAGGIIPPADAARLKEMGVEAVFTPGARRDEILGAIGTCLSSVEKDLR